MANNTLNNQKSLAAFLDWKKSDKVVETPEQKAAKQQATIDANMASDTAAGKKYKDNLLGEDFALSRLNDNPEIQNVRNQLNSKVGMSDAEKIAQRESAYGTMQSQEATQNRSLLRNLNASGVKGGAAAGAIGDLASVQASNQRALNQNLFLQQSQTERQGLQDLTNFELNTQQFDIGQQQAEMSAKLQTQLAGTSLASNERASLRQQEAALAAADAQSSGGKK